MKLKACTDFMSGEFIQIFSHAINHSHYSYRTKLITAEDRTFHLVTSQSLLAVSTDIETRPSLAIIITTPGAGPRVCRYLTRGPLSTIFVFALNCAQ